MLVGASKRREVESASLEMETVSLLPYFIVHSSHGAHSFKGRGHRPHFLRVEVSKNLWPYSGQVYHGYCPWD